MKKIIEKWGPFIEGKLINKQVLLNKKNQVYLNILYKPVNNPKTIFSNLNSKVFNELLEFYKEYNGVNLCSHSFIIYGLDIVDKEDGYKTSDISIQNVTI